MTMKGFIQQLHDEGVTPEAFKDFTEEYLDRCFKGGNYELALGYMIQSKMDAERDLEVSKYSNDNHLYESARRRLIKLAMINL